MQSNDTTEARTQRRERREATRAIREQESRQRGAVLALQNRRRDNQRLAAQPLGMLQVREQSIGRIIPFTGLTRRPQRGLYQPQKWTAVFIQLLRSMLSSLPLEQQNRVEIRAFSDPLGDGINIFDHHEHMKLHTRCGATKGNLVVSVLGGAPKTGLSGRGYAESNWSARICDLGRNTRIRMYPSAEIAHRIVAVDPPMNQNLRLRDFPSWEHGVSGHLLNETGGYYNVYHTDEAYSYPSVRIVAEVIKEHYLRMDMPGPDAPWDA
jgi:hypothetical protein